MLERCCSGSAWPSCRGCRAGYKGYLRGTVSSPSWGVTISTSVRIDRRPVRALVAAICAAVTGLSLGSGAAPALGAAPTPALTAAATPATALTHSVFYLTGKAVPRGPGVVTLQRYVGGQWKQLTHKTTSAAGTYGFALRATTTVGTTIYRVTRPGAGSVKTLVSRTVHVYATKTAFKVSATAPTSVASGAAIKVTGTVAKATGTVVLEELQGTAWKSVATAALSSKSTFAFSRVLAPGKHQLRVRKPWSTTIAQGTSKAMAVTVKPPIQPGHNPPTVSVKLQRSRSAGASTTAASARRCSRLPRRHDGDVHHLQPRQRGHHDLQRPDADHHHDGRRSRAQRHGDRR